ncbi:hypothetical protein GAY28_24855 [Azospirillum brasilense]|nr:hypothetical protein [Azospirillum brasilense]
MQIDGHENPETAVAAAREWCANRTEGFTAAQLEGHALGLGVDPARTMRFADRVIQKLKKDGAIRLEGRLRRWFPAATPQN